MTLDDFHIGKYEVTVGEYLAFADATNSHYPEWLEKRNQYHVETGTNTYYKQKGYSRTATNLPVAGVSWKDAIAYCKWLSRRTGKNYRLPIRSHSMFQNASSSLGFISRHVLLYSSVTSVCGSYKT